MAYTQTEALLFNINYRMLKSVVQLQNVVQGLTPKDDREALLRVHDLTMAVDEVVTMFERLPKE
jgi:hypothetical protein